MTGVRPTAALEDQAGPKARSWASARAVSARGYVKHNRLPGRFLDKLGTALAPGCRPRPPCWGALLEREGHRVEPVSARGATPAAPGFAGNCRRTGSPRSQPRSRPTPGAARGGVAVEEQ
jgi:hypothetical protein